jgi:thiamine-phosphate pyrophosphorylase
MSDTVSPNCRLVLVTPALKAGHDLLPRLAQALSGGDVAAVILAKLDADEQTYNGLCVKAVPLVQGAGAAALVDSDTRIAGRSGADGIHFETSQSELARHAEDNAGRLMLGAGGAMTRHTALDQGELQPDYVMFGKLGADTHDLTNPKLVDLAAWWSEIVEVPCILLAGRTLASVRDAAATGADFVAVSSAVFDAEDPAAAVAAANAYIAEAARAMTEPAHVS